MVFSKTPASFCLPTLPNTPLLRSCVREQVCLVPAGGARVAANEWLLATPAPGASAGVTDGDKKNLPIYETSGKMNLYV
jgi:hypothetical protein